MILQMFLESFFAKMAYWLYSFKSYFSVIAINPQPKSEAVKTNTISESLSSNEKCSAVDKSRQYRISSSDNAVLGYVSIFKILFYKQFSKTLKLTRDFVIKCDVWQDWMVETLADMQKLRNEATSEKDFNRLLFAQQMIDRIRNVKSEIVNAQGTVL